MTTESRSLDATKAIALAMRPTMFDKFARRILYSRLNLLQSGQLVVTDGTDKQVFGAVDDEFPEPINVNILSPSFYSEIVFGGSVGSGSSYMSGSWTCDNLRELLRVFLVNRDALDQLDSGTAIISRPLRKIAHFLNKNTRDGSRKNIAAHYDIGNDFYKLWLDPTMMYSSAYFEQPDTPLDDAAVEKLDRICRKLDLNETHSVVEIGSGWGGFAIHAAGKYGCRVTTTTISQRQHDYAKEAIEAAGLESKITLLLRDYRDLEGQFDKLVSIEMIEAVGHDFHETYFKKCCSLLKPDGEMLLQAITIADQRYEAYRKDVDFINHYIFPGGCLTSITDMSRVVTKVTDMRAIHLEDIGPHYATTLRHWRDRFFAHINEVRAQGYSESFIRMWEFYLCYCESAFAERVIGDVQLLLMRPDARREHVSY